MKLDPSFFSVVLTRTSTIYQYSGICLILDSWALTLTISNHGLKILELMFCPTNQYLIILDRVLLRLTRLTSCLLDSLMTIL